MQGGDVITFKNADGQVGEDQARAFALQDSDLFFIQRLAPDLDRGMFRADGERQGGGVEKMEQDLRKQVLGGVLLHVVVAALKIELQTHFILARILVQHMDDVIVRCRQLPHRQAIDGAMIGGLASARRTRKSSGRGGFGSGRFCFPCR